MAAIPDRTRRYSDEDAVPMNNPTTTTELLAERLQAWKHMCAYLEDYISEVAKDQKSQGKDSEKMLKTLSHPLKEAHHFDQSTGGVAGLFENLRSNTHAQSALHTEMHKNLTGTVLPILEKLHAEIKSKAKELDKGAGKGTKAVESARSSSQKHIELLGQHTAGVGVASGKASAHNDPYVLKKQVANRLNKQLIEENNNRGDLIAVQNSFSQFEAHVLQTVQAALNQFNQFMSGQADRQKAMYGDMAATAARIPADFEWNGFVHRNSDKLISPDVPVRTMDTVSYPNQDHRSTQALIEGSLDKKGRGLSALGGYSSGYFAVTPAGFLHEFKDSDNYNHDPTPETSLYLPDCLIGAVDGVKFTVKGKDISGNKLSQKIASTSEYSFKAHSPQDAAQWHSVILSQTNASTSAPISPVSTVGDQKIQPMGTHEGLSHINTQSSTAAPGMQQQGVVGHEPMSATSAHTAGVPQSATSTTAPDSHLHNTPGGQVPGDNKY